MRNASRPASHLAEDLQRLFRAPSRREALRLLAGGAALSWLALGARRALAEDAAPAAPRCAPIPREAAGPFAGNAARGPNVLDDTGIVRGDIRTSLAPATGRADGVTLDLRLKVVDAACRPLAGRAVYVWHCDRVGRYSLYSRGVERETWLRGVQVSGADGEAAFRTVFPGCYPGRWPHVHFEVYRDVEAAVRGARPIATSQLAFPRATCEEVYVSEAYAPSRGYLARLSLERDGVFADGVDRQMVTIEGTRERGYVARLDVGLPA